MEANFKNILKAHKIKITKARITILKLFAECDKPQSVEVIEKKIKGESINQVTVYRTVESFVKAGIIGRVDLRQDSVYYELVENHHHHIVCVDCGVLEDFDSCQIEKVTDNVLMYSKKFKTIKDHSFELFGICNACVNKNA